MMNKFLRDVKGTRVGTDYIILKLPKRVLKKFTNSFYLDMQILDIRDGAINVRKYLKRRKKK